MDFTKKELLNYALENDIIDIDSIQKQLEMNERRKYQEMHKNKIWQGKDGYFYTKVLDETKSSGRRMIKKSTQEKLNDAIIEYYKEKSEKHYVESVFEDWMQKKLKYGEIQQQTYDRYKTDFDRFFPDNIKHKEIKYFTETELEDFIRTTIYEKRLTAKAWSGLRTLLSGMFKYAKKMGYTNISITSFLGDLDLSNKIFYKKIKNDEECVFNEKEMQSLVSYLVKNPKLGNLGVLFAVYTGMRVGEIVALKWEDINNNYIYVHRTQIRYYKDGKEIYEIRDTPKTEAGVRKIVIVDRLKTIIKQLRLINPFTEYVFEKNNKPITKHVLDMCLYRACEKINIQKRGMHVLRKTYATRLINSNVDEAVIINQMGHTDISTTKNYYYYNDKTLDSIAYIIGRVINY